MISFPRVTRDVTILHEGQLFGLSRLQAISGQILDEHIHLILPRPHHRQMLHVQRQTEAALLGIPEEILERNLSAHAGSIMTRHLGMKTLGGE